MTLGRSRWGARDRSSQRIDTCVRFSRCCAPAGNRSKPRVPAQEVRRAMARPQERRGFYTLVSRGHVSGASTANRKKTEVKARGEFAHAEIKRCGRVGQKAYFERVW